MTTADWTKYSGQFLTAGDEVEISDFSRKLSKKRGIVEKMLQKNISVYLTWWK